MEGVITRQGSDFRFEFEFAQTNNTGARILLVSVDIMCERIDLGTIQTLGLRLADVERVDRQGGILAVCLPIGAMMVMVVGSMHVMVEVVRGIVVRVLLWT